MEGERLMNKKIVVIASEKCKGCYLCVQACPKNTLEKGSGALNKSGYSAAVVLSEPECIGCLGCALMCPDGAITIYEEENLA